MFDEEGNSGGSGDRLRQRARQRMASAGTDVSQMTAADIQALVEELQIHQAELTIQTEELQEKEEMLRQARDRYRDLFDQAPVAYLLLDDHGRIREANGTAAALLGSPPSALAGMALSTFVATASQDEWFRYRRTLEREGGRQERELALHLPQADGERGVREVRLVAVPEAGTTSGGTAFRITLTDITEQRRQEAQRENSRRLVLLGELGSVLAHQLKQPLAAAQNYTEGTLYRLAEGHRDQIRYGLEQVRARIRDAGEIIGSISRFLSGGDVPSQYTPPAQLLDGLRPHIQPIAGPADYALKVEIADDLPEVLCSPTLIRQCLINLAENAVEAMGTAASGKTVTLGARSNAGGRVELYVADQGPGFAADRQAELVQPLVTTKASGTGLGLSVCHSIAEIHGGRLWATSNAPAPGATLHLSLPTDGPGSATGPHPQG